MFNNPFSMVVAIVFIVMVASVLRARYAAHRHRDNLPAPDANAQADRLREEMNALKERVAVLERIATDAHDAARIDHEIARLRDR